jgi:hypothetical protein
MIQTVTHRVVALAALCGAVTLTGCKSDDAGDASMRSGVSMGAVNDTCPVMTGKKVDPDATMADFEGTKVGFCCDGCINKWNTMSYAQKKQFLAQYQ